MYILDYNVYICIKKNGNEVIYRCDDRQIDK